MFFLDLWTSHQRVKYWTCLSRPLYITKAVFFFHSGAVNEKTSSCKEKIKSPGSLSTGAKTFGEWVQRACVPAFRKYISGYFLACWFKLTALANDRKENAVSKLAVDIQMTNETVQRAARQSVRLSLATAVLASGKPTTSPKASGFRKAGAAWTCDHRWPHNSSKAHRRRTS